MTTRLPLAVLVAAGILTPPSFAQQAPAVPAASSPAAPLSVPKTTVVRAPDTIMFTIDELTEIQNRAASGAQSGGGERTSNSIEDATLYLSTILYSGPNDWTIWVNGVPISPGQEFQSFQVSDIKPSYVELTVPLSALGMRPVRLSPNQTFVAKSGAVIEGPWR